MKKGIKSIQSEFSFIIAVILFLCCDKRMFIFDGDSPGLPNILNPKDSIAIRAILDANGLYDTKVHDAIYLYNNVVQSINISNLKSTAFLFTSSFDSLRSGSIGLYLTYNKLDTLLFQDTVYIPLFLSISHTKLRSIPNQFSYLSGNLSLDLQNNQLRFISPNIMKCKVDFINVKNNFICSVPDSLNQWMIRYSYDSTWQKYQNCN